MKIVLAANSTVYLVTLVLSVIAWKGVPAEKKSLWMFTLPGIIGQFCGVGILASYVHRMQREVQSVRTAGRESRQLLRRILQVGIPAEGLPEHVRRPDLGDAVFPVHGVRGLLHGAGGV